MDIKRYSINTEVDKETKEAFKALANRKGLKTSELMRLMIKREIEQYAKCGNH